MEWFSHSACPIRRTFLGVTPGHIYVHAYMRHSAQDQGEETSSHKPGRGTTRGEWFLRVLETGRGDTYKPPRAHRLSSKSIIALHGLWLLIGSLRSRGPEDRHVANSAGPLSPFIILAGYIHDVRTSRDRIGLCDMTAAMKAATAAQISAHHTDHRQGPQHRGTAGRPRTMKAAVESIVGNNHRHIPEPGEVTNDILQNWRR